MPACPDEETEAQRGYEIAHDYTADVEKPGFKLKFSCLQSQSAQSYFHMAQ